MIALRKLKRAQLEALVRAGQKCSNVCYNLKQKNYTLPDDADSMERAHQEWDHALQLLPTTKNGEPL